MDRYFPQDGDVVRIRYTTYYGSDIGEAVPWEMGQTKEKVMEIGANGDENGADLQPVNGIVSDTLPAAR